MLKLLAITTLLALGFSGCTKETVIYPPCVIVSTVEEPKAREIRVYKDDEELVRAYIGELRSKINAMNTKVKKANELCEKWRLKHGENSNRSR